MAYKYLIFAFFQIIIIIARRAMTAMNSLREKLGDISDALVRLNRDPKDTDIGRIECYFCIRSC